MNQIRSSAGFVFALGALAVVGCQNGPAEPVGSASLTSAEVVAGAPPPQPADRGEELTCDPSSGADAPYCGGPVAAAPLAATLPAGSNEPFANAGARAAVRRAGMRAARANESAAVDEAIRHEVASDEHESTASAEPVSPDVTTTSALVSARPSAPMLAPTRVTFENHLSRTYRLARVRMMVDGAVYYDGSTSPSVQLPAGDHTVEIVADYEVPDSIFSSAGDSRMEVTSTQSVHAGSGDVIAAADPAGGVTTPIEQRVKVGWRSVAMP